MTLLFINMYNVSAHGKFSEFLTLLEITFYHTRNSMSHRSTLLALVLELDLNLKVFESSNYCRTRVE